MPYNQESIFRKRQKPSSICFSNLANGITLHDDVTVQFNCFFPSLPKVVKRRVNALKNLQVKCAQIEAKFYEEVHELERKYALLYQPLFDKVIYILKHLRFESLDSNTRYSASGETRDNFCQIITSTTCTCENVTLTIFGFYFLILHSSSEILVLVY